MPKQTRSQRKQIREKRDRAETHGLPVGPPVAERPRPIAVLARNESTAASAEERVAVSEISAKPSVSKPQGWSSWPLSLKLLLVGIVILIGIGLYRRYNEDKALNAPAVPAQDSH